MSWLSELEQVNDRRTRKCLYSVPEILFAVLMGTLCGQKTLVDIDVWAEIQIDWLRKHLPYASGTPSHDTLGRVLGLINPSHLEGVLTHLMRQILAGDLRLPEADCVLAVDGKALRGSKARSKGQEALNKQAHVVHAFLARSQTLIGMEWVDEKSNEITAVPKLFDNLDLRGMVVTMDAMGAQKDLLAKALEAKAEVVVSLKGNQGTTHADTRLLFEQPPLDLTVHTRDPVSEKDHGRLETRTVSGIAVTPALRKAIASLQEWPSVQSLIRVQSTRQLLRKEASSTESRYFLSTLPMLGDQDVLRHGALIRAHWGVENHLHRTLDVVLHEDDCTVRDRNVVQNLAIIRRLVLSMIQRDPSKGASKHKMTRYQAQDRYRDQILALWNKALLPQPQTRRVIIGR